MDSSEAKWGVCSVCARTSSVTKQGRVRSHRVPRELLGRNERSPICDGSGLPPVELLEEHVEPPTTPTFGPSWEPETHILAQLYNAMHTELCSKGMFCSAHQPAYGILEAARKQRDSLRSTVSEYSGIPEEEIRQLGDV